MSLIIVLLLCGLILTVAEALGKCPGWVPMVFVIVAMLVAFWGGGGVR